MKRLLYFTFFLIFAYFSYADTSTQHHKKNRAHKTHHKKKHHHHKKHRAITQNSTANTTLSNTKNISSNSVKANATAILNNTGANSENNSSNFNPVETDTNTIKQPRFYSYSTISVNANTGEIYTNKNPNVRLPIASISKLMTAMVILDSDVDLDEKITISEDDVDHLRHTFSRLRVGAAYTRRDLLLLALMSSENRAAHALARTSYPGGLKVFIAKMNAKSKSLGMTNTQFYDPTGLDEMNRSTAMDLSKMVHAAFNYSLIRQDTTTKGSDFNLSRRYIHHYINSDSLVRAGKLNIVISKTGFINEAGHCLVLYIMVGKVPVIMVFLNSSGKNGRILDAIATKNYIQRTI